MKLSESARLRYQDISERNAAAIATRQSWIARRIKQPPRYANETIAERSRRLRYGLTPDKFNALMVSQDGQCRICRGRLVLTGRGCHVDHDHETGLVRGLLCFRCNIALGWYELFATEAEAYLRSAREGHHP